MEASISALLLSRAASISSRSSSSIMRMPLGMSAASLAFCVHSSDIAESGALHC